jgi:hypothetical protein
VSRTENKTEQKQTAKISYADPITANVDDGVARKADYGAYFRKIKRALVGTGGFEPAEVESKARSRSADQEWQRAELKSREEIELDQSCTIDRGVHCIRSLGRPGARALPPEEKGLGQVMTGRELLFTVIIAAIAGSLLQDLVWICYALPNLLRPAKTEPQATDPPIMASVLDDMQSLGLIELTPDGDKKPPAGRKPQTENAQPREKAAA